MSAPECLITGCALVKDEGRAWAWGDLHRLGDCFIFNAVLEDGQAKWHNTPFEEGRKAMVMRPEAPYFERRGVIVIPCAECDANVPAAVYAAGRLA